MLIRSTLLSNTKKFFNKTFQSFKSLINGEGYQRIPKTPPSCFNNHDLHDLKTGTHFDNFYTDFSNKWEESNLHQNHPKPIINNQKKKILASMVEDQSHHKQKNNKKIVNNSHENRARRKVRDDYETERLIREKRRYKVKQKMKKLVLVDMRNMDHLMDIEEILHYYSFLTCPVYLDIVEKFIMDLYSDNDDDDDELFLV